MKMEDRAPARAEDDLLAHQARKWIKDIVITVPDDKGGFIRGANGTGVLLKVGEAYFLSTAKHIFDHAVGDIELVAEEGRSPIRLPLEVMHTHNTLDLAIIELSPSQASSESFAGRDNIVDNWDASSERPLLVSGYPDATHFQDRPDRMVSVPTHTMMTLVPPSDWPSVQIYPALDKERDILIERTEETYNEFYGPGGDYSSVEGRLCSAVKPGGLSGGAVSIPDFASKGDAGIKVPNLQLVGIEVAFRKKEGVLRALRIGLVLDLIEERCPHLAPELNEIRARRF